ncbi:arf-GAP domain and FG repeat-containing protein 1-like isoform X1 [Cloeon dipterum]|uniref:arf-GAP domain and FG repeat-containing protein 1-like isoform X1 n=1 Tax=Cloeon dipterum TaxID=197152 RepID=UPI0032205CCC
MRSKKEEKTVVPPAGADQSCTDPESLQESLSNKLGEMASKKKQDEKNLKLLRELTSQVCNKHCFDCQQRGPTYVNMTIGSFVCTTCSGLLRGLTPPHRVKSISMASFTDEEIALLKSRGNEYCRRVWLGLYDSAQVTDVSDDSHVKDFMVNKYERKRYYLDPSKVSLPKPAPSPQLPQPQHTSTPLARPSMALPRTVPSIVSPNNNLNRIKVDPFSPLTNGPVSAPPPPPQDNFANFDNVPIFNAAAAAPQNSTPVKNQSNKYFEDLSFLDSVFTTPSATQAFTPNNNMSWLNPWPNMPPNSVSTPPMAIVKKDVSSEDRYAALKDLDSMMKGEAISSSPFNSSSSVFDSALSQNQSSAVTPMFLSPDSTNSNPGNPFAAVAASSPPSSTKTNPWDSSPSFPNRATNNPFESVAPATNGPSEFGWSANFQDAFNGSSSPFNTINQENNNKNWAFNSNNGFTNGFNSINSGFNNPFSLGGAAPNNSSNPFL